MGAVSEASPSGPSYLSLPMFAPLQHTFLVERGGLEPRVGELAQASVPTPVGGRLGTEMNILMC